VPTLDASEAKQAYRLMRRIRRFENRVRELVDKNEIPGVCHEYIGQEAVAVGVCAALGERDVITSTHRGHGHLIAKGGKVDRMLAELFGRRTGYNRGKGGSMHIADLSLGIYGANGIVGAGLPIAAGAAWESRAHDKGTVAVGFFGDGGANQGVVHETLNLAAIWKLPMLFVCENNQYAISASIKDMSSIQEISRRAEGYGMPGETVDGMDVEVVHDAAGRLIERARRGEGPALLECKTYRFVGHFTAETALGIKYRTDEEIETWRRRDPIATWRERLAERGVLSAAAADAMDQEIERELDAAIEHARASPWPEMDEALEHMYVESGPNLPARGWL